MCKIEKKLSINYIFFLKNLVKIAIQNYSGRTPQLSLQSTIILPEHSLEILP